MLIYYGTGSKHIATEVVVVRCDQCSKTTPHEILVFQKYGHLYGLPFVPASKETVSRCTICRTRLREYEMTPAIASHSKEIRNKTRTRWWTFVGFLVVGILISTIVLTASMERNKNSSSIANCKPGQIYTIDLEYGYHTLVKIDRINGDTVFLILNSHEVSSLTGVDDLAYIGNFTSEPFPVLKYELIKMAQDGDLSDFKASMFPTSIPVKRNSDK